MRATMREALGAFWPRFLKLRSSDARFFTFSNYPRAWVLTTAVLVAASFIPLGLAMLVDYGLEKRKVQVEETLRVVRLASNAKRAIAHFLTERLDALAFTVREVDADKIRSPDHLTTLLTNLNLGFGGVSDLGVIDGDGLQVAYSGPYDLLGKDYRDQPSYRECRERGTFVSGVFLGHRGEPHVVIAVRCDQPDGVFFILRATVEIQRLVRGLESFPDSPDDDVFLIDREGTLQTPSRSHGAVLERVRIPVPPYTPRTQTTEAVDASGKPVLIASSGVVTEHGETPFILTFVRNAAEMTGRVTDLRVKRILFFTLSMLGILLAVLLTLTYMFNRLYESDRSKVSTILKLEQSDRLASLGRLAAGVAHEINNPLAVINEDAGYVRDLLTFSSAETTDEELLEHMGSIIESVDRCRAITRQLLGFARKVEVRIAPVDLRDLIESVLSFHRKEAEHRSISVEMVVPDDTREIVTDRGKLQQVLLNVVNNAFQVLPDGGRLDVIVGATPEDSVSIAISDTGGGIPPEVMERIFEPFFTTKGEGQGTGLGLAISYGLVRKLRGRMSVTSEVGQGSTFTIVLPRRIEAEDGDEAAPGR